MMSTPAATSVESVREKRAIVIFSTVSPIRIGSFSLKRSHFWRPFSVFFHRKKIQSDQPEIRKMRYSLLRSRFDTATTYGVSVGSWPFSDAKIFTKIGTRNMQHPDEDERREDQDHRRVDHRALDAAPDRLLLLDLERDAVEHDVEDAGRLAGLDHRDVEAREDLRVRGHRLREQQAALDVLAQLEDDARRAPRRRSAPRG